MAPRTDDINSVIGEGSVFEGKFYINGSLQISGKFEGEIHSEDHLIITETGRVKTDIIAKRVTVAGTLIGNINASEEVILQTTGRVSGNIATPNLDIQKGAVTKGSITITGGHSQDVDQVINDSFSASPNFNDTVSKYAAAAGSDADTETGTARAK